MGLQQLRAAVEAEGARSSLRLEPGPVPRPSAPSPPEEDADKGPHSEDEGGGEELNATVLEVSSSLRLPTPRLRADTSESRFCRR